MGRKSGNITMQLNKRIDDLLRIGEKKVKDDPTNSNRVEGIHSIQTASTYRAVAKQLGEYLKEQGKGYTVLDGYGSTDKMNMIFIVLPRREMPKTLKEIRQICDNKVFVVASEVSKYAGGYGMVK